MTKNIKKKSDLQIRVKNIFTIVSRWLLMVVFVDYGF